MSRIFSSWLTSSSSAPEHWDGHTVNVGGGATGSLSLLETTAICAELTGHELPIGCTPQTRPGDVPVYISDCAALHALTPWRPSRGPREILADIQAWITAHERELETTL